MHRRVLKFNVGFLLVQGAGNQRVVDLDIPRIRVDDDLELEFLRGELRLSRNSQGILVQAMLETSVISECVRCLTSTVVPVTAELQELFSYPPSPEAVYSVDETGILDLALLLREEVILALPMGSLCRPDCAGLCPECGQNWNEGPCDCDRSNSDLSLAVVQSRPDDPGTGQRG